MIFPVLEGLMYLDLYSIFKMKRKGHFYIYVVFMLLGFVSGCENLTEDYNQPEYKNPIKIGVVGDVSVLREQVENMFFGAQLASEEINKKGGLEIDGETFELELIYRNSGGSAEKGVDVCQELKDLGVDFIIGPTFSSVAVEMANFCIENQMLMMTYSATTPELTYLNDNNLVWRTCPSDASFGNISAMYCYDSLKVRNAGILYRNDRFGQGLSEIIENMFVEKGGRVWSNISFPVDQVDISTYNFNYELNTIFSNPIDILFIVCFNSEIAAITNRIYNNSYYQALDKKPLLFVNDGVLAEEILTNGNPELLETIYGITSVNEENINYNTYKNNYIGRFGFMPATYSETAYDAVYCLSYAIMQSESLNPIDVAPHIWQISGSRIGQYNPEAVIINVDEFDIGKNLLLKGDPINYEGASGPLVFDIKGDPFPKMVIWKIKNNQYTEVSYYLM